MQPPPRKGQYLKVCKNLHSEQISRLQAKNQQECDLLEDIRNFTKQRSAIEKSYGEALCKISATYLNRKIACVPDIRLEDGSEAWNVYSVWRTVLDETEKLGKARLAAVEVFHQRVSEDAKQTRQTKINLQKKLMENLSICQKELQAQVQDLDRAKKAYYDEENVAYDAREKASAAEEKLKRKKGSLFQSISSLQKNSAKFTAKKELCDEKSAGARNDYILYLAAANAHQRRYYEIDFERILRTMENDVYDKVQDYLSLISRTELLTCTATQNSYTKIREQAQTITRGYNLRCYLTFYPMLGKNIEYDFDPCKGDRIDKVIAHDENSREQLNIESKNCVATILKEVKTIRDATKKIHKLQASQKADGVLAPEVEMKIEDIRQIIRRCETSKYKAESKLEALREGGIEVEDYSKSIDNDSLGADLETQLSRSGSSLSVKDEGEAKEGDLEDNEDQITEKQYSTESYEAEKEPESNLPHDQIVVQSQKSIEPVNWDPLNVEWGDEPVSPLPPATNGPPDETVYPKCIVQYNYTAQNVDELTIVENEELEVISEGDGDGWIQARNYKGEVGYVPQNYVEMEEGAPSLPPIPSTLTSEYSEETTDPDYGTSNGVESQSYYNAQVEEELEAPVSFSSIDYSFETGDEITETEGGTLSYEPPSELPPPPPPPTILAGGYGKPSLPVLDIPTESDSQNMASFCRALYDYEATCPEELTFEEGQVIRIVRKTAHDVDDGWWQGEIDGVVGLFPSLVVEECRMDGEPLTPDVFTFQAASLSSPCTTPPPHTPPEVPGFLLPPEKVIITMPTPDVETADLTSAIRDKEKAEEKEKDATGKHYNRQFSSSPDSETATEKDHQYAELVSSPDVSNQEVTDPETLKDVENSLSDSPDTVEDLKEDAKNENADDSFPPPPPLPPPVVVPPEEDTEEQPSGKKQEKSSEKAKINKAPTEEEKDKTDEEKESRSSGSANNNLTLHGLDVAQIIVTAATPMKEVTENEEKPIAEDSRAEADQSVDDDGQAESEDTEGEAIFLDDDRPPPPPPAPEGGGGSGVEERKEEYEADSSSASSSIPAPPSLTSLKAGGQKVPTKTDSLEGITPTPKSPSPSDGPPDLDPEKLKTLEKIKESIA